MNLSYFAYIDESEDPAYPTSTIIPMQSETTRGEKFHVITTNGGYDLVGLDAITYTSKEDLVQQVNTILKEMNL